MRFGPWELPAGVNIAPSIFLLHRREDIYPDPLAFRPERFLDNPPGFSGPPEGKAGPPGTYEWIPFGGGVRRCLGASFAMFEMKAVLRAALGSVRLREAPGRRPEGTTRRAITLAPTRGGRVVVDAA